MLGLVLQPVDIQRILASGYGSPVCAE